MPWSIRENFGSCSGYAVVKDDDESVAGCHDIKEEAAAQIAALHAAEADNDGNSAVEKRRKKQPAAGTYSDSSDVVYVPEDHVEFLFVDVPPVFRRS